MSESQDRVLASALRRLELLRVRECLDPVNPDSRPTSAQQEMIDDFGKIHTQWIVAANQAGKTQVCARLLAWFITETHPTWQRPATWGEEPLLAVVAGRTGKHIEETLWTKVRAFLEPGTYKEVRIGLILQRVEMVNGNRIVFQSLENPNSAADRLQSYVAHLVWLDEMPPSVKIISEAMVRRNSRSGYFMASFTPLIVNDEIRRMVDSAALPHAKKYRFRMFDNPVYFSPEKQAEVLASMATLPEHMRNTRLYGDWTINDDAVYYFDYDEMIRIPEGYSPLWRHVESVDPALKSALGLTIWAEEPTTGFWYCVHSEYVKGIYVPTDLVRAVQEKTKRYNIIRRIADPHEVWYIQTASSLGIHYIGVYQKNSRKGELIKQLQEKLGQKVFCTPASLDLTTEFQECRWSDKADQKIVNSSSYHLLDSAQYFCDNIPKYDPISSSSSWHEWLYKKNEERVVGEEKKRQKLQRNTRVKQRRGRRVG